MSRTTVHHEGAPVMHTVSLARRALVRLAPVVVIALLVAACSGGASGGIKVSDPWARASQAVDGAGAAYMVIENTSSGADTLIGGSSPAAGAVEVHETVDMSSPDPMASDDGMGTGSPMMGMQRIERLEIPAGGSVELKPGSYHVMLIGLTQPLEVGQKIEITLTFEKAGDVKVTAEVREG
ncbi:MAG: copper chaperone PCu(A)C [Chloroflexi bacterium]|nr:copper chaperone PCu(A)C [Chloroflexota bacterium]